jgi:hypothetical protein
LAVPFLAALAIAPTGAAAWCQSAATAPSKTQPRIEAINPPDGGFYAKKLDYYGIPIKAPAVVADAALQAARTRLDCMLGKSPNIRANLAANGAELHIIGKNQVTSDLPEHRHLKGKPLEGTLTVDQRTRGLGGLLASCGEENLLRLPGDRYAGRDICVHEFAHTIRAFGLSDDVRQKIKAQYRQSLDHGKWKPAYAATNDDEFFAELSMWYFGTHGDTKGLAPAPLPGREGLRRYDAEAFDLLDSIYSGRIPVKLTKLIVLPSEPIEREAQLRSVESNQKTEITFRNRTAEPVELYWLDYQGKRHSYGIIQSGGSEVHNTFVTHVWLLASKNGRVLGLYVARAEAAQVLVEDKP